MFRLVVVLLLLPFGVVNATHNIDTMVESISISHIANTSVSAATTAMGVATTTINSERRSIKPQQWPSITQKDLTAIYQTLKFEYSAALMAVDDMNASEYIRKGYHSALEQAQKVSGFVQYRAVLNSYIAKFDDVKVNIYGAFETQCTSWPGVMVKFNQGYWVSLDSCFGHVNTLVSELEHYQGQIRQSDYVVLDVRGHHGGDSQYAHRIATALFGHKYATHILESVDHGLSSEDLSLHVIPKYRGQVVLLTDEQCSSSCLLITELFLKLGAVQVGRTTEGMNRYYDTKQSELPSGLSSIVTSIKADVDKPEYLGPFKPRYIYDGDMNNTQKLKTWVLDLLAADRD